MDVEQKNFIISDDQDNTDIVYDISERIYELRDELSLDIISRNIISRFEEPTVYETPNYITKFKETYKRLKENDHFADDESILNNALQELCQLVNINLENKFLVNVGDESDDDLILDVEEYLDKIETLYNFFIVRHYTNIKDYFKSKLMQDKLMYIEKYKMALDDKTYDDLFLSQDKKKYKDISDAIIIHFITDIISDIRSEITSAYSLFNKIIDLDLFEEFNFKMSSLVINYGNDFFILDDNLAVEKYFSILDNTEVFVTLRNDLLSMFLSDAKLSD